MAIADTGKEFDAIPSQFWRDVTDNRGRLFRRYVSGGEILHEGVAAAAAESHQIAAKSDVLGSQGDSHACRFERRATGMIDRGIVAHDAHVTDIAARRESFWYHMRQAKYSARSEPIHVWRPGGLQWGFLA